MSENKWFMVGARVSYPAGLWCFARQNHATERDKQSSQLEGVTPDTPVTKGLYGKAPKGRHPCQCPVIQPEGLTNIGTRRVVRHMDQ